MDSHQDPQTGRALPDGWARGPGKQGQLGEPLEGEGQFPFDHLYNVLADELEQGNYGNSRDTDEQAAAVLGVTASYLDLPAGFGETWADHVATLNEQGWDGDGARDDGELAAAWLGQLESVLGRWANPVRIDQ